MARRRNANSEPELSLKNRCFPAVFRRQAAAGLSSNPPMNFVKVSYRRSAGTTVSRARKPAAVRRIPGHISVSGKTVLLISTRLQPNAFREFEEALGKICLVRCTIMITYAGDARASDPSYPHAKQEAA